MVDVGTAVSTRHLQPGCLAIRKRLLRQGTAHLFRVRHKRGRRVASSTASVPKQVINPSRSSISIGVITDSYTAISFNSISGSRNTCATSDSTDRNSGSSITDTGSTKISSTTRDFPQRHSLTTLPNKKKPENAE
jgi:hypothetical protein